MLNIDKTDSIYGLCRHNCPLYIWKKKTITSTQMPTLNPPLTETQNSALAIINAEA